MEKKNQDASCINSTFSNPDCKIIVAQIWPTPGTFIWPTYRLERWRFGSPVPFARSGNICKRERSARVPSFHAECGPDERVWYNVAIWDEYSDVRLFFWGVFFRSPVKRPSQPVRAFPALRERESDKCGNTARKKRSVVVGARFSSSFA